MFAGVRLLAEELASHPNATACHEAAEAILAFPPSLAGDIEAGAAVRDAAVYLAAEEKLLACAPKTVLDEQLTFSLQFLLPVGLGGSVQSGRTLAEALTALNARAKELDERTVALHERLERNQIGLYTTEQEADDVAVELSARVGIAPEDVIEGMFDKMRAIEASSGEAFRALNNGMTTEQCRDAYRRGFPTHVPLGALSNLHHAFCYRVFNMLREQTAHHYEVSPPPPPLEPSWAELQATVPPL